jgi:Phage integrase family
VGLAHGEPGVVRAHRRRGETRARLAGLGLRSDSYVFSRDPSGGRPWRPDSTSRAFRHLCHDAGLDQLRLHDVRHFVATRLLASGVDVRTVSGRLGHSLASTTLNVYAAFVPDADPPRRPHHQPTRDRSCPTPRQRANPAANPPRPRPRREVVVSSNRTSATRPPTTRRGSHDTMLAIATPFLRVGGWHAPARRADRTLMGPLAPAPLRSRSCPTRCVRTEPDSPRPTGHFEDTRRVRLLVGQTG